MPWTNCQSGRESVNAGVPATATVPVTGTRHAAAWLGSPQVLETSGQGRPTGPALLRTLTAVLPIVLAGCTNLSGLGGSSEFQCKAPDGVPCQSISGVHHNERAGNLPFQRPARAALAQPSGQPSAAAAGSSQGRLATSPTAAGAVGEGPGPQPDEAEQGAVSAPLPVYRKADVTSPHRIGPGGFGAIRSDPVVIRMWVAPWEDADGDLNDQTYVYLQVDSGRWLIEHNRAQVRREFAPRPAAGSTPQVTPTGAGQPRAPGAASTAASTTQSAAAGMAPNPTAPMGVETPSGVRPKMPPEAVEALRRAAQQGAARGAEGPPVSPQGAQTGPQGAQGGRP